MRKKTFSPARGWRCDSFVVESTNTPPLEDSIYETAYGRGFLEGMFSRPSCEKCPAKNMESGSDITLGDFWGVENYFPDLVMQEGLSIIICKTLTHCWNLCAALCPFYVLPNINGRQRIMRDYVLIPGKTLIGTPFSGSWPNAVPIRRRSI